jgi:hypothetical protein
VTELCYVDSIANHTFLVALDELKLSRDDFVIFGSGPLLAHGIRREIGDLDIVARGRSWEWAREFGEPISDDQSRLPRVYFWIGNVEIEIGPRWYSPQLWDTDELIDNADVKSGFRFARIDDVRQYKTILGRQKDMKDIDAIDAYIAHRAIGSD